MGLPAFAEDPLGDIVRHIDFHAHDFAVLVAHAPRRVVGLHADDELALFDDRLQRVGAGST